MTVTSAKGMQLLSVTRYLPWNGARIFLTDHESNQELLRKYPGLKWQYSQSPAPANCYGDVPYDYVEEETEYHRSSGAAIYRKRMAEEYPPKD